MAENSSIEWTHHTFNPWLGCTKISPACDNCYAESWAKRTGAVVWGGPRRRTTESYWRNPLKWNREAAARGIRPRVFCASLADVFDNEVPAEWRSDLFRLIYATPNLDWLLLTKRIGNARAMIERAADIQFDNGDRNVAGRLTDWYKHSVAPENVWLGATVANQAEADRDIPKLLAVPARVKFLSCEPLLGPVHLGLGSLASHVMPPYGKPQVVADLLHWVIVGGESGPKARPLNIQWAREILRQCNASGVAAFVKQLGRRPYLKQSSQLETTGPGFRLSVAEMQCDLDIEIKDGKGGDPTEWPIDLRIRQFPITNNEAKELKCSS